MRSPFFLALNSLVFVVSLYCLLAAASARATVLVSGLPAQGIFSTGGGGESAGTVISADGRFVAFASTANNLVTNLSNGIAFDSFPPHMNVFLRDTQTGISVLISANPANTAGGNGESIPDAISADGRYVLFESTASNLVPNDTNNLTDVFLRDTLAGTTALISIATNRAVGNGESMQATMTPDAHYVAFASSSSNLVVNDSNGITDIFIRDTQDETTTLASVGAAPVAAANTPYLAGALCAWPTLSADGRYVAFYSTASGLTTNARVFGEVYLRELSQNLTIDASAAAHLYSFYPVSANYALSTNGQYVAFISASPSNTVALRYNFLTSNTDLIATNGPVPTPEDLTERNIDISADGRFVAFAMTNPVAGTQIELWDVQTNSLSLISGGASNAACEYPRLDQSGRYVAFQAVNDNLPSDHSGNAHIYVRDTVVGHVQLVDAHSNPLTPLSPVPFTSVPNVFSFSADGSSVAFDAADGTTFASSEKSDVFISGLLTGPSARVISYPATQSLTGYGSSTLNSGAASSSGQDIVFRSYAPGLTLDPANGFANIFTHDFLSGTNSLVSADDTGQPAIGSSLDASISGDGRYVAFSSLATNLTSDGTNGVERVYLRDTATGANSLISIDPNTLLPSTGACSGALISSNGFYVLFQRAAVTFGDTNAGFYIRDIGAGLTYKLGATNGAAMTPDGSNTLFAAGNALYLWQAGSHSNITIGSAPEFNDVIWNVAISPDATRAVFATDYINGSNYLVNLVTHQFTPFGADSNERNPFQFSGDSRFLAYLQKDSNGITQVWLYDWNTASNTLISQSYLGSADANAACDSITISSDSRFIAYRSAASNLVPNATNGLPNIYLFDRSSGMTSLISSSYRGNFAANGHSLNPTFSGDGKTLFFESWATDLVPGDFNQSCDVFAAPLSATGPGPLTNDVPPLQFIGLSPSSANSSSFPQSITLTWPAAPGAGYQIQFKDDLTDPDWQNLAAPISLTGSQAQTIDPSTNLPQRFYRIVSF